MKKSISLLAGLLAVGSACAQPAIQETDSHSQGPELHLFATFTKSMKHNLALTLEEEIRSAPTHRSHTTVALTYTPIPYLSIYTGYTLKLYGNQGWTDVNKFLRHRANFLITGQVKLGQWNLSLREGVMLDARADKIDTREKNAVDWTLRSRLQAVYSIPKTPLAVVTKLEMLNTLNAPVEYLNSIASSTKYGEYISEWRPEAGLEWKINKQHSLTLTYRYNYIYGRNIDIQDNGDALLTNDYSVKHLILLAYKLGW